MGKTSREYLNRSSTSQEFLAPGWNGFSQNFPPLFETFNHFHNNSQETFENLMINFCSDNADETIRKINENTLMPIDESVYKILLEKVLTYPKLIEKLIEILMKFLRLKNLSSSNLNCTTQSSMIKIAISNKLEVLLEMAGEETAANNQLLTVIKLITKLYQNAIISKVCVNYFIDLIKMYENGNKCINTYTTMLKEVLTFQNNIDHIGADPNSEMTSSGEWSDLDSETSRHGFMR